ncbi:MAG: carboxypeptidase-like regulatory domain-containing protein, partial [Planctomycetota bacterium]
MNRTRILLPVLFLTLMSHWVFAATTGKVAGVVRDVETGDVLPGANVILEGTTLGAASDTEGRYHILNVPVGEYDVRAEVIGYKAHITTSILVTIDHTTTVNFDMETTVLAGEEVTVTAERPLIQMDNTATRT